MASLLFASWIMFVMLISFASHFEKVGDSYTWLLRIPESYLFWFSIPQVDFPLNLIGDSMAILVAYFWVISTILLLSTYRLQLIESQKSEHSRNANDFNSLFIPLLLDLRDSESSMFWKSELRKDWTFLIFKMDSIRTTGDIKKIVVQFYPFIRSYFTLFRLICENDALDANQKRKFVSVLDISITSFTTDWIITLALAALHNKMEDVELMTKYIDQMYEFELITQEKLIRICEQLNPDIKSRKIFSFLSNSTVEIN